MKRKNRRRFNMVIFVFILLVIFTFCTSFNLGKKQVETYEIKVNSNDTIWNIAKDICNNNNSLYIQNVILDIQDINNLTSSDIYVGQTLNIPIY